MASIDFNGVPIPLIADPDDWEGREVLAIERMVAGGIETAGSYGQTMAMVGISIARAVPTFLFPDSILSMKGRELNPLLRAAMDAVESEARAEQERQKRAELEAAGLSPTSAGSAPVTLSAEPTSPTPGTDGGFPLSSGSTSTPATSSV